MALLMYNCWCKSTTTKEYYKPDITPLLTRLKSNMDNFVKTLHHKHPHHPDVTRLAQRYKNTRVKESTDKETYTLNKGESMLMCMRNFKNNGEVHDDMNLLMFVGLHELAHIMSVSAHHTEEFWKNFKYLLEEAARLGFYRPIDYSYDPVAYCAMTVYDNPFFHTKSRKDVVSELTHLLFE